MEITGCIGFLKPTKKDIAAFSEIPQCIKVVGKCPPEDIGGSFAYANFLRGISNEEDPEYEDYCEMFGIEPGVAYDEMKVDLQAINDGLRNFFNRAE